MVGLRLSPHPLSFPIEQRLDDDGGLAVFANDFDLEGSGGSVPASSFGTYPWATMHPPAAAALPLWRSGEATGTSCRLPFNGKNHSITC